MCLRAHIKRSITGDRALIIFVVATSSGDLQKRKAFEYSVYPFEQHPIFRSQHVLEEAARVWWGGDRDRV
jgi:hypothetical protein